MTQNTSDYDENLFEDIPIPSQGLQNPFEDMPFPSPTSAANASSTSPITQLPLSNNTTQSSFNNNLQTIAASADSSQNFVYQQQQQASNTVTTTTTVTQTQTIYDCMTSSITSLNTNLSVPNVNSVPQSVLSPSLSVQLDGISITDPDEFLCYITDFTKTDYNTFKKLKMNFLKRNSHISFEEMMKIVSDDWKKAKEHFVTQIKPTLGVGSVKKLNLDENPGSNMTVSTTTGEGG